MLGSFFYGMQGIDNVTVQNVYEKIDAMISKEYTIEEMKALYRETKTTVLNMEDYIKNTLADIDETMEKERINMIQ